MEEVLHSPPGLFGTLKQARFVVTTAPIVNRTVQSSSRSLALHEQGTCWEGIDFEGRQRQRHIRSRARLVIRLSPPAEQGITVEAEPQDHSVRGINPVRGPLPMGTQRQVRAECALPNAADARLGRCLEEQLEAWLPWHLNGHGHPFDAALRG